MILERGQLVRQRDAADIGADPVDGAHEIAGMEQCGYAGAAPRIGAAIAMQKRQKQRRLRLQIRFLCQKYIDAGGIRRCDDLRQPQSAHDIRFSVCGSSCRRKNNPSGT